MAVLVANSNGEINGKFTIPANVSAGSKLAQFIGAGGSNGNAVFFGQGILQRNTFQELITTSRTLTQINVGPLGNGGGGTDPLAQTFSLAQQMHIGGVELFVTAKGTTPIAVQIRETQVGFPTATVLAEAQIIPSAINVNAWNRWTFAQPVVLLPQIEYAIVVLCNDAVGAIATAELGKFDTANNRWVTNQPYQVGVLLSSSNASTWTAHQDKDMTFRLLACQYSQAERTVNLGNCAVTGATDLIVLAPVIQPASGADSEIVLTLPGGGTITASDRQVVRLPSAVTGNVGISVKLRSTQNLSALLLPGTQLIAGAVDLSAVYVSRAIDADATGVTVKIIYDAIIPSGAGVTVEVAGIDGGDPWLTTTQVGTAKPLGDNVYEYQYSRAAVTEARIRVRVTLTGTVAARPIVSNLRVSVV
jgi:hypothetical protein